jgi:hypothetical protein
MLIDTKVKKSLKQCKSSNSARKMSPLRGLVYILLFSTKISPRRGFLSSIYQNPTRLALGKAFIFNIK